MHAQARKPTSETVPRSVRNGVERGRKVFDDDYDDRLPPPETYRLELDGEWDLWEFSGFGKHYVQCYSLFHLLIASTNGNEVSYKQLDWALHAFPWKGGWSTVDFFDSIVRFVPSVHKPRVRRIEYSSPGFIEISVGIIFASYAIRSACAAYDKLHDSYRKTQRAAKENKLLGIDIRKAELDLRQEQIVTELAEDLRKELAMKQFEHLFRSMKVDDLAQLRVMLALARRMQPLSKLQRDKNIHF